MIADFKYCSLAAIAGDEPLIGSAKHNSAHFVLGLPKVQWDKKLVAMDGPAGEFARIVEKVKGEAIFTLRNCPPEETGTVWLMPHKLRFDSLRPEDYPELVNQTLNGEITLPSTPLEVDKLIFVCTHGLRDPCCAKFGGLTLARLYELAPPNITVWESSHLGGHRFAGVVVTYPGARWYGRMTAGDVPALIDVVQKDAVLLKHYRGNATLPPPLQVAERWGLERLDDGELHLLNPLVDGSRAQVEVWITENGDARKAALTLEGHTQEYLANCSDESLSERMVWKVSSVRAIP